MSQIQIRPTKATEQETVWELFRPVIVEGNSYPLDGTCTREDFFRYWFGNTFTAVAEWEKKIVGGYYLRPNQPGRGSHVANGGYFVAAPHRGRGIGRRLCLNSLEEARRLGYLAIQFNLVVSTNEPAVHLWISCGFEVIGTAPRAFRHPEKGLVDALIMYRDLADPIPPPGRWGD